MVENTKQKIVFNGGSLHTALLQQNIKPENFFGIKVPNYKELRKQIENDAWYLMHPVEFKEVGAQQWNLVHPIGSGESDY